VEAKRRMGNLKCGIIGCTYEAVTVRNGIALCWFHNKEDEQQNKEKE